MSSATNAKNTAWALYVQFHAGYGTLRAFHAHGAIASGRFAKPAAFPGIGIPGLHIARLTGASGLSDFTRNERNCIG